MLHVAAAHGHNTLVLGALGCGVFQNPPDAVAELWHELLSTEFRASFARVIFACYSPEHSRERGGTRTKEVEQTPTQAAFAHLFGWCQDEEQLQSWLSSK